MCCVLSNLAATPVTAEPLRGDLVSAETQFLLPPAHVSAGPAAAARRHGPGGRKHEPTSPLALRAASSELPGVAAADEPVPWADFANVFKGKTLGCQNCPLSQLSQVSTAMPCSILIARQCGCCLLMSWPAFIGSNYLGIPFAFRQAGLGAGIVGVMFISTITVYCCLLLVKCRHEACACACGFHLLSFAKALLADSLQPACCAHTHRWSAAVGGRLQPMAMSRTMSWAEQGMLSQTFAWWGHSLGSVSPT